MNNARFVDCDLIFFKGDCDNVIFLNVDMDLVNEDLTNISLDDDSFRNDSPEIN